MKTINLTYLVDDDPLILLLNQRLLSKHDAFKSFISFKNGELAISHLKNQIAEQGELPDLILLDLNMPVMDGWEFLDACSQVPQARNIPVCILSSSIDPDDIIQCKGYKNVKAFFSKPLTIKNVEQIIGYCAD